MFHRSRHALSCGPQSTLGSRHVVDRIALPRPRCPIGPDLSDHASFAMCFRRRRLACRNLGDATHRCRPLQVTRGALQGERASRRAIDVSGTRRSHGGSHRTVSWSPRRRIRCRSGNCQNQGARGRVKTAQRRRAVLTRPALPNNRAPERPNRSGVAAIIPRRKHGASTRLGWRPPAEESVSARGTALVHGHSRWNSRASPA